MQNFHFAGPYSLSARGIYISYLLAVILEDATDKLDDCFVMLLKLKCQA